MNKLLSRLVPYNPRLEVTLPINPVEKSGPATLRVEVAFQPIGSEAVNVETLMSSSSEKEGFKVMKVGGEEKMDEKYDIMKNSNKCKLSEYGDNIKRLGEGSYGTVELYQKGCKSYAIKIVKADDYMGGGIGICSLREMVALKYLDNSQIIDVVNMWCSRDNVYIVMNAGFQDLYSYNIEKKLSDYEIKDCLYQIALGIAYYTNEGIFNRDIKPGNVVCYKDVGGEYNKIKYKIIDFGLSRMNDVSYMESQFTDLVYTIWYRPPEVLLEMGYNPKVDVWAFGCIIAELNNREPLMKGRCEIDQLKKIIKLVGLEKIRAWKGSKIKLRKKLGSKNYNKIMHCRNQNGNEEKEINLFPEMPDMNSLLNSTLELDQENRPSIYEVLEHKYFDEIRDLYPKFKREDKRVVLRKRETDILENIYEYINYGDRIKILCWMRQIFLKFSDFNFTYNTYILSVQIFDIIISSGKHKSYNYKLIAITSILIASKLCDETCISIVSCCECSEDMYSAIDILRCEEYIVHLLDFKLYPTTWYDYYCLYSLKKGVEMPLDKKTPEEVILGSLIILTSSIEKYTQEKISKLCINGFSKIPKIIKTEIIELFSSKDYDESLKDIKPLYIIYC